MFGLARPPIAVLKTSKLEAIAGETGDLFPSGREGTHFFPELLIFLLFRMIKVSGTNGKNI